MKTKMNLRHLAALALPILIGGCQQSQQEGTVQTQQIISSQGVIQQDTMKRWVAACDSCGACDNTYRWTATQPGGGREILPATARTYVIDYNHDHPEMLKGAFLSKIALDSIFCHHADFNGIYCYLGKDDKGNTTMIFEGWRDEDTTTNKSRVEVVWDDLLSTSDRYRTFITQTMCPAVCGYCGQ